MNDVMKKRLIGVAILVLIGVATPLLLSRCMHSGAQDNDQGSMRVYNVQPNGKAKQADHDNRQDQGHGQDAPRSASGDGNGSGGNANSGRENRDHKRAKSDDESPQGQSNFSTPPVHGDSGGSNTSAGPSDASQPKGDSSGRASQHNQPAAGADHAPQQHAPDHDESSHDYGSGSIGSQPSQENNAGQPQQSSGSKSSQTNNGGHAKPPSGAGHSNGGRSAAGLEKTSIHGWVVQVASFSHRDNAESIVKKLKGRFKASYTPGKANGKTLYRVNLGPFDSKQAANSAADKLSDAGHKGLVRHLP